MMPIAQQIAEIRKRIDARKQEKARAEGALAVTMKALESEFGVKTVQQAEKELDRLEKEMQAQTETLQNEIADFSTRFGV